MNWKKISKKKENCQKLGQAQAQLVAIKVEHGSIVENEKETHRLKLLIKSYETDF